MALRDPGEPCVFNVNRSVSGRSWKSRLDADGVRLAAAIAQQTGLPDMVSRVLAGRGVALEGVDRFWQPSLKSDLPDPATFTDMGLAADRIAQAVETGERVAIFGDYDVDGATSTSLLVRFLGALGLHPVTHIPDRLTEGYGPSVPVMTRLAEEGATLILCVDCGATSMDAIAAAASAGADVVVIDHHQVGADLPPAFAMVNPNRQDDLSGQGHLAAVGVTFLVCVAVNGRLRERNYFRDGRQPPDLRLLLDLVALGTVCDVVPLTGVNRAFVTKGLLAVEKGWNPGLRALCRVARLYGTPTAYQLGFMLGPRINAGGRIGKSGLGLDLLTGEDEAQLDVLAAELDTLNQERQALEKTALEEAVAMLDGPLEDQVLPIVVAGSDWHPGIVGLIASRLSEKANVPSVAIALREDGSGTGSARSVPGFDLGTAVREGVASGLLIKGGGHEMAAGMTLAIDRLEAFAAFLSERFQRDVPERPGHTVRIDSPMTAGGASLDTIGMLEKAGPFGAGHPAPVFAFPSHRIAYAEPVGGSHVRCRIVTDSGDRLGAIAFRAMNSPLGETLLNHPKGAPLHLCGTLSINTWRGERSAQLSIRDAALPSAP
ncbi:MAG: single-stranded-DNA-specific exonuclease RecJ [Pseudomonadota bacterium]